MRIRNHRRLTGVASCIVAVLATGFAGGWIFGHPVAPASLQAQPAAAPEKPPPPRRENRLGKESSPYLQLHKHNPVDWFPWGAEAFEKAEREGKFIFLSVGYSSCYWCHVMERESFSDPEIARLLNEHVVCIKVDREELPDVDAVYMNAAPLFGSNGGWPLSVFMTPDRKPFHIETYRPPHDRNDTPGFLSLVTNIVNLWKINRTEVEDTAARATRTLQATTRSRGFSLRKLDKQLAADAVADLARIFDPEHGGFGFDPRNSRRPKFPQPPLLELLVYQARAAKDQDAQAMLGLTLERMAAGGIWDHVGGGFHRYSTDRFWLVPHFEKMLYDNAQLARVYLQVYEQTKAPHYEMVAREILTFVAREMTSPEGGFYSALDAESEHEEGKYYAWRADEIKPLLTPAEFALLTKISGLDAPPNFPPENPDRYVLHFTAPLPRVAEATGKPLAEVIATLKAAEQKLLAVRLERIRPLLDTKILTDWNGLMIAALADAQRVLGDEAAGKAAARAADLLLRKVRDENGRLLHTYTAGVAKLPGYLEDHAYLLRGLVALYGATNDERWLNESRALADQMVHLFWDDSTGGFFRTASDQEIVLTRLKSAADSVLPSGNSAAVQALVELARHTKDDRYAELAGRTLAAFAGAVASEPSEHATMLRGLCEYLDAGLPTAFLSMRPAMSQPRVLRINGALSLDRLVPGRDFQVAVMVDIDPEWHIYANPASRPEFLATTVGVSSELPIEVVDVQYPAAVDFRAEGLDEAVSVYSGRALIRIRAKLAAEAKPGRHDIELSVRYQACNNQRCLAPKTIGHRVTATVAAPGEKVREMFPDLFRPGSSQPSVPQEK
jgi:uncharacterized protein YyaL (SSP411 family)